MVYHGLFRGREMKRIFIILMICLAAGSVYGAETDPVTDLKDHTMAYFKPLSGKVTLVEEGRISISIGEKEGVRSGMRLKVLREGAPFVHPVTKEFLGNVESTVGKIEIKDVQADSASGAMVEGEAKEGDRVRLSDIKVRVLFCQGSSIDWYLADDFYRKLKSTERIEMVDTGLETDDETEVLKEARKKGAEVALLVTAKEAGATTIMRERLYWVSDGTKFLDAEAQVGEGFVKELKFGEEYFAPRSGAVMTMFDLPFGARLVATGDVYGDGKQEVLLSTGSGIRIYQPGADLKLLAEVEGSGRDDHLWMDTVDLDGDGKDEIVVTSMRSDDVVSSIYGLDGPDFRKIWEGRYFLRKLGNGLIAQAYTDGFSGDIFSVKWDGKVTLGEKVKTPQGVNIYDFVFIQGASNEKVIFAYDDDGYLNVYNNKGIRTWRSGSPNGGFLSTFKKQGLSGVAPSGSWSVKDRLVQMRREVLVVKRFPLADVAKGLGYKKSDIQSYWWNGFSMEEGVLIEGVKGSIQDYALSGDEVLVLASPFLGVKFDKILKGENPFGVVLYIYSIKGR